MYEKPGTSVALRLGLSFFCLIAFLIISLAVALNGFSRINSAMQTITQVSNVEAKMAGDLVDAAQEIGLSYRTVMIVIDGAEKAEALRTYNEARDNYLAREKQLADMLQTGQDTTQRASELMLQIQAQRPNALALVDKACGLGVANLNNEAKIVMLTQASPAMDKLTTTIKELNTLENQLGEQAARQAQQTYLYARNLMVGLALVAIVIAILIALLITRNLMKTLGGEPQYVAGLMRELAAGNLMVEIQLKNGDTHSLAAAISSTIKKLRSVISEVQSGASSLSSAAQQLSATSQSLSQGASESAAGIEQTSSSIEEISALINQTNDNAKITENMASQASLEASEGGDAVRKTVTAM